ncbi:phosphopantothenoylcysteine decarboxylase /phosphopantothenoylcysteine synthetase [Vibrio variabilis]|uniref:Phosphopantothenoylcysteine decarboxylase /phosphopantothenoylcysteine synthetase n=1 Tax=Vibrio variabilis TaxID=990271 RepID=A0ABQ0JCH7_9VIBR|nr:phosphopantothenoylcysteine decarboxylase /phosphopantothenoylcysteine synthetase [Vibrio variabilis]
MRYISNHSSGKMGFALAEAASQLGAQVTLIAGPVSLSTPANVERIDVVSAEQMHKAALEAATKHDIFIGCAAVATIALSMWLLKKSRKRPTTMICRS